MKTYAKIGDISFSHIKESKLAWEHKFYNLLKKKFEEFHNNLNTKKFKAIVENDKVFDFIFYNIYPKVKSLKYKTDDEILSTGIDKILFDHFIFAEIMTGIITTSFYKAKYDPKFKEHVSNLYDENKDAKNKFKYTLKNHAIMDSFIKFPKYRCSPDSEDYLLIYDSVKQYRSRRG